MYGGSFKLKLATFETQIVKNWAGWRGGEPITKRQDGQEKEEKEEKYSYADEK